MKRLTVIATLFLAAATSQLKSQQAQVVDGVAAIVNNDVITISQLREMLGARERAMREVYKGAELAEKLKDVRNAALQDLIDRQLILQEFKKLQEKGANIPEYVIDDRIQSIIRDDFGGDRSAFIRTIQAQGFTLTKLKEIEREKIIVQAMRQSKVNDNFVVSPTQVQSYYDKNRQAFTTPDQVKLRMIVLREDGGDDIVSGGNKQQIAEEIRQKIAEGAEFDRMAQMYSEDESTQESGGDWGWIERNTLNEELTAVAFSLRAGEVSKAVKIEDTYYILLIEARKNATVKPISEVRDEIERNLIQQERQKSQDRWLETLRRKAYIKILA